MQRVLTAGRLLLLLMVIAGTYAHGQTFYSTNPGYLRYKPEGNNPARQYVEAYPDTTIDFISEFFPRNFLGNYGLSSPRYLLNTGTPELGFRLHPFPIENDRFRETDAPYYRTVGPFASLTGIAGSRELQIFRLLYTQTFRRKLNVTLRFNRYTSMGFYQRQQSYTNNFFATLNRTATRDRAGFYAFIMNNGNRNQENGGILDGTLSDSTAFLRKELMRVRLSAASRTNDETVFMINPWIRLIEAGPDTSLAKHILQVKSRASFSTLKYTDTRIAEDNFYRNTYFDSTATSDSTRLRQYRNEALYSFVSAGKKISFSGGYRNEVNRLWQYFDSVFMNHSAVMQLVFRRPYQRNDSIYRPGIESVFDAQYILAGAAKDNFKLESATSVGFKKDSASRVFLNVLYERRLPDHIYNWWAGNHYLWTGNGYLAQNRLQAQGGYSSRGLTVSGFIEQSDRYLYFDESGYPRQGNAVTNAGARISAGKIFFRHLGTFTGYAFQQTSRPDIVRMPPHVITARLFFNAHMFRDVLQLQLGGQVQVYDTFVPYAYMPATQVFHLQNTFSSDPFPYLDLYLQGRIRPVNFFVKMENVLRGYAGNNYALVRGYYQPEMAFRFGITWIFFD